MPRLILVVAVVIVAVVGALFLLAGRAGEQPQVRVEKPVTLSNML